MRDCGDGRYTEHGAHIIPTGLFDNTRPHLQALAVQINGTYQSGFYDACAVMCRRLLNCLLLLAFESAAKGVVIRDASGEYRAFARIVELASSSRHIKLPRGAGAVMGKMDYVGDLAAHHPTYTTRQKDIDEQRLAFRARHFGTGPSAELKSHAALLDSTKSGRFRCGSVRAECNLLHEVKPSPLPARRDHFRGLP